jgi:hypothetical protein
MKTRGMVLGLVALLGGVAPVWGQSQATLSEVLPRVREALARVDAEGLQAFGVNEYAVAPQTFAGVEAVRMDAVKDYGVQRFQVYKGEKPVFELEAIFAKPRDASDGLGIAQPWHLINLRELTEAHDDYLDVIRGLHPNLKGRGLTLPASAHENRFRALAALVHADSPAVRRFLEENSVTTLLRYELEPIGETLYILRGLEARYADARSVSFDLVFEKNAPLDVGRPTANWYITYTTLAGLGPQSLFDRMMARVVEQTGAGEEDAAALLFDMVDLFEDLEVHLNLIADPERPHDKRLETVRETVTTFFESDESVVQISSKKYGLVIPRSVDRYLRRLSRLDELFGYRRVRFDFEKGVEFQDIQKIAGEPDAYDAVFVLWQIFESENADGRIYQDATKKRFRAVIRRVNDNRWDIKLTQVLVDDTQTLEVYLRYIRPSLVKGGLNGGI